MLEQFYKNCRNELIGWCTTLTHDPMLAEDLVHEAFLRAMEQYLATLESLSPAQKKAWFYRVIKNMYIDRVGTNVLSLSLRNCRDKAVMLRSMTISTGSSCLIPAWKRRCILCHALSGRLYFHRNRQLFSHSCRNCTSAALISAQTPQSGFERRKLCLKKESYDQL